MKRTIAFSTIGLLTIFFSCLVGFMGGVVGSRIRSGDISDIANSITQDVRVTNEESAIIQVAESASPSVVSIVITQDVPVYENYNYFYRRRTGTEERQVGAGTGFIVSTDGMIITNKHVVDQEDASYTVILNDGTKYQATVLARDTLLDIAFLRIDAPNLKALTLGTSENLKVGQTAIAIGNALGEFSNTVSTGIISGLQRNIVAGGQGGRGTQEQLNDVIQTDASINFGNSGGPLLNINGEVIGVNVAIASDAQNIGFAIPIDVVKDLMQRLNSEGKIERPSLGVRYILINEQVKQLNNLSVNYGALVARGDSAGELAVIPGSPADKAGLIENDIILEVNGKKVNQENPLQILIQSYKVGDEVTLKILRKGTEQEIKVKLEQIS